MTNQTKYTPVGSLFTRWPRLREVSVGARWVWLALYTGNEAKMCPAGLFFGSIYSIANAAGMTPQDADQHMHELVHARLVLWDVSNELVRLLELPDNLSRAHTEQAIHGWWGKFINLPPCALRDSHVPQLHALVSSGKVNDKMRHAWTQTFGTIRVPKTIPFLPSRSSSDTGTKNQPSLFSELPATPQNSISMISGTAVLGPRTGSGSGSISSYPELGNADVAAGEIANSSRVVVGPWEGSAGHLRGVPAERPPERPTDTLPDVEAEARNAHADEMKAIWEETARAAGADFLIPVAKPAKETS